MRILVVGAGQMGAGIAQVAAQSGHDVLLADRADEFVARGMATITKNLDRSVEKGRLTAEGRGDVLKRIVTTTTLANLDVDLAVEAATEHLDTKLELFRTLDAQCSPRAILASNTSSISITLARRRNEAPGARHRHALHESRARHAAGRNHSWDRDVARNVSVHVIDLAVQLGKTPVEVRDFPGFISNRVLMPMINEAIYRGVRRRRHGRSDRHGHEARHEPSDGPAHTGRLHRARHVSRDHERAARRVRRFEIPAVPAAAANTSPPAGSGKSPAADSTTTGTVARRYDRNARAFELSDDQRADRRAGGGDRAARDRTAHRALGPRSHLSSRPLSPSSTTPGSWGCSSPSSTTAAARIT